MKLSALVLTALSLLSGRSSGDAAIINAISGLLNDVSNAVASALPGDTVQLPAGRSVWTQTIVLNGVSLKGAGTNLTVLVDEVPRSTGGQMIKLIPAAGHLAEISNFQFQGGATNTSLNFYGTIECDGSPNTSWRIDHNVFNGLYGKNICTSGESFSVIDHNAFYEKCISVEDNGAFANDSEGDQSYSQPPAYGLNSSNVLYVEDNYFTNLMGYVGGVGVCDGEGGARIVFRHNVVYNDLFNNHGTETGGRLRSERSFEIYNNTFTCPPGNPNYPIFAAAMLRGGSGVIFSNVCSGYNSVAAIRYYRYTDTFSSQWAPFGGANGTDPWDSNSPTVYLSGTSSLPNGSTYLQVAGANWTTNQWVGYTLLNTNSGLFSVVVSNNANTLYYIGGENGPGGLVHNTVVSFNTGDHFQLRLVYAALDQPGRGSGDLLRDNGQDSNGNLITINTLTGTPSWPREVLEPIYCWSNTVNGTLSGMFSDYPGIRENRDFYNNTPKPEYTPYTYPHPLVGSSTNKLLPPTNIRVIGSTQ